MAKNQSIRVKRRAFTLIELLTVIAIIVILVGMLFTARKYITATTGKATTVQIMETCQSLVAEWNASGTTTVLWDSTPTYGYKNWSNTVVYPSALTVPYDSSKIVALRTSVIDTNSSPQGSARDSQSVGYTRDVLARLSQLAANKTLVAKLPSRQLYTFRATGARVPLYNEVPVILDGWGNPILYVPAGGLRGVAINGQFVMVTSAGIVSDASFNFTTPPATPAAPVGAVPFWASAGPDGDFSKGDDNIYSFEK